MQHRINYSLRIHIMPIYIKKSAPILKIQKIVLYLQKNQKTKFWTLFFIFFCKEIKYYILMVKIPPQK